MNLLRTGMDHWGREVVIGVHGWLFWLALGLSAILVVGHMLFRAVRRGGRPRSGGDDG